MNDALPGHQTLSGDMLLRAETLIIDAPERPALGRAVGRSRRVSAMAGSWGRRLPLAVVICVIAGAAAPASAERFPMPDDARAVNVRDFGAKGDGVADDTAPLRAAISHALTNSPRYGAPRVIYLPDGTYRVSDTLESRVLPGTQENEKWNRWRAGMYLLGESQEGVVIKLTDETPDFGDASQPRAIIRTGSEAENPREHAIGAGNRAFRHYICNMTVDAGKGNPGAVGIDYVVSNRGAIRDVTIVAAEDSGHTGLAMERAWPGPALIKGLTIEGFGRGVAVRHFQYGMTFEDLMLSGQRGVGIHNKNNALYLLNLKSDNRVPAVVSKGNGGFVLLINSRLSGGASDAAAVRYEGTMLARNLEVDGYGLAIDDLRSEHRPNGEPGHDVPAESAPIELYISDAITPGGATPKTLNLPIKPTPSYELPPLDRWANVLDYGATVTPDWSDIASQQDDDATGIQAAIDSGKPVVYLPNGMYFLKRSIVIRGNVRILLGMAAAVRSAKGARVDPLIRFDDTDGLGTIIEHIRLIGGGIEHNSPDALTFRHGGTDGGYRNTAQGTGDLFMEDVIVRPRLDILHPQNVWLRQFNAEWMQGPWITNRGGTLWVFGMKTEGKATAVATEAGGRSELLGGLFYREKRWRGPDEAPLFTADANSEFSASFVLNGRVPYPVLFRVDQPDEPLVVEREAIAGGRGPALLVAP